MTISRNRITSPLTVANAAEDLRVEPIPQSPTGLALIGPTLVKVGTVIAALAAVGTVVFAALLPAPFAVTGLAVCASITSILTVFGIVSPGARAAGTTIPAAAQVPQPPPISRIGPPL